MTDDIPSPCDLLVIGTGLTESIVASAASRIGKQVVHVDHRDFYGSNWATFSFNNLHNVLGVNKGLTECIEETKKETYSLHIGLNSNTVLNVVEKWFISDEDVEATIDNQLRIEETNNGILKQTWTKSEVLKHSRKFNFDLSPKLLYSKGEMVEVLISSGICRYAEFKNVSCIYTYDNVESGLLPVPCSRADIFNSKDITMIEKRLLMKILSMCMEYETKPEKFQEDEMGNFGNFLDAHKIQGKVRKYLIDSVAMAKESTNFQDAVKNIQKFVRSIGRYGNTPFLWTLYGSGELPQCFCRCSAVFGGVYCLKRSTQSIIIGSDGQATGIMCDNQNLKAKFILIEDSLNPLATIKSGISRAILVTNKALTSNDQAVLINLPSLNGKEPVRILELSASTMACPQGLYVVHLITRQVTTAIEDLREVIDTFFSTGESNENEALHKPQIIWSLHFNINEYESYADMLPLNMYSSPGPNSSMDFDNHVIQARNIFKSMFPDEDFLPRVPDPEDVILEGSAEEVVLQESLENQEVQNVHE
ncbi:rab proteins geranylgeranyltransferase component A 2-like [Daphnia pulex]|uniref:rab proteins geranylgeranyltransferase component A 2-like n=1 Tax=Daphnia pulex TaxID=6669 RepID=UPI001EDCCE5D|nr:rab proteins geranylgeranyltransferase component A 2-like [Daphnia pulex]